MLLSLGAEIPNKTFFRWTAKTRISTSGPIMMLSPILRLKINTLLAPTIRTNHSELVATIMPTAATGKLQVRNPMKLRGLWFDISTRGNDAAP